MADMVISGAPVSVLLDHGLDETIVEQLVAASIGTVEKLGSMTPEQLEAIPNIDEAIVSQIQSAVVSFYGQYDEELADEAVPADAASVENAIDATTDGAESERADMPVSFENIQTGVLDSDLATHKPAALEKTEEGEVLDLGRVEGLSAAPSILRGMTSSGASDELAESVTIDKSE